GCGIGYGLVGEVVGEVLADSEVNETSDGKCSLDQARKLNMAIGAQFPMFARTLFSAARGGWLCFNHTLKPTRLGRSR
ncbi:MAG: hypothetical protein OXR64_06910, partial [Chloroflexota bacterium]|nr:hypothetical protein [Chloroflexota bacterium]